MTGRVPRFLKWASRWIAFFFDYSEPECDPNCKHEFGPSSDICFKCKGWR